MATISKFYFHDAATTNTGTMPTGIFVNSGDSSGDATGARTARAADDVIGALQTSATITATANTNPQNWGYRRFVSPPLAAQTIAPGDGNWTFSCARAESNLNHNQLVVCNMSFWSPSSGAQVGANHLSLSGTEPTVAAAEQAESTTSAWALSTTISDGDIIVFEVYDSFIQAMATAYTSTFYYDGTTEGSTTSCASFVAPPSALTLFTAAAAGIPDVGMGLQVT